MNFDSTTTDVQRLNNIIRYNPHLKCHTETVAAHSFFVSFYASEVCTELKLCDIIRLYSLEGAIHHDVPESFTNDITHDVKQALPRLKEVLAPVEEEIINKNSMLAHKTLYDTEDDYCIIAKAIVEYADIRSVVEYCKQEAQLGNKFFTGMQQESEVRLSKAKADLSKAMKTALKKGVKIYAD